MNKYFRYVPPFLNLKIRCTNKKPIIIIVGIKAGYKMILSQRFPFNNSINDLCMPHPGHSMPKYFL